MLQKLISKLNLREEVGAEHQTYALGLKEVWEVDSSRHKEGMVEHLVGYPLDSWTYGGAFIYHMEDQKVSLGLVVALDYWNTYLNPYQEFQRFKSHPYVRRLLEDGECLEYGARTLNEGMFTHHHPRLHTTLLRLNSVPRIYAHSHNTAVAYLSTS